MGFSKCDYHFSRGGLRRLSLQQKNMCNLGIFQLDSGCVFVISPPFNFSPLALSVNFRNFSKSKWRIKWGLMEPNTFLWLVLGRGSPETFWWYRGNFVNLCIFLSAFYISSSFFFFFFFVLVLFFSSMVSPMSGTHSIDQASLEFTEICLPLPGIKGMRYHTRLVFLKMFQTVKGLWPSQVIKICNVVPSLFLKYWGSHSLFFGLVWFLR